MLKLDWYAVPATLSLGRCRLKLLGISCASGALVVGVIKLWRNVTVYRTMVKIMSDYARGVCNDFQHFDRKVCVCDAGSTIAGVAAEPTQLRSQRCHLQPSPQPTCSPAVGNAWAQRWGVLIHCSLLRRHHGRHSWTGHRGALNDLENRITTRSLGGWAADFQPEK
jgi:hypothetical protein